MTIGKGSTTAILAVDDIRQLIAQAIDPLPLDGRRVLVIIPDGTRSAPIPLFFRLLYEQLGRRVAQLDYLIALGTHAAMPDEAIDRLVGVRADERKERYPNVQIYNHHWDKPNQLQTIGVISRAEADRLTDGLLVDEIPVTLNRLIHEYDQLIICGPVFPHEVAGFSGGAKYLFPGIAGADIINFTHWLGALITSMKTIGVKDTPVRRVIERAAEFVQKPLLCMALVMQGANLHGLYTGPCKDAWSQAADLSAHLNIITVDAPFRRVLSMPSEMYDDLWTAAKAMYKTEPAIAGGGEVIIYAPHLQEISYTHGKLIDQVGYHVRDYFLKQWDRFKDVPGSILAHSTHVKGTGAYDAKTGIETPRIQVTLATGIPEARCRHVNLGYADYKKIDPEAWKGRENEGILVVPHAGEMLYRAKNL
ncbi:MAG TPA: lactate racemase domain-containing protein [Ktedonobacteraceae bacterium]|jgi:nickel-dependent lactate racemase|nr:lactate racemase domain-containing protein [Ktedonobacteraceae bacterium]